MLNKDVVKEAQFNEKRGMKEVTAKSLECRPGGRFRLYFICRKLKNKRKGT